MTAFQNAYSKGLAFDRARLTRRSGGLNHAVGVVACQTGVRRRPTVPTPRETVPNNTSRPEMGGRKYPAPPGIIPDCMFPTGSRAGTRRGTAARPPVAGATHLAVRSTAAEATLKS